MQELDKLCVGRYHFYMARPLSESRRKRILDAAKHLFARNGFSSTSITDIVQETGFPVGSLYTYFQNKEAILATLIEEGWNEFFTELSTSLATLKSGRERVETLIEVFLPRLLKDWELISILFSEGLPFLEVRAKIDALAEALGSALLSISSGAGSAVLSSQSITAGIMIIVLGVIDAAKMADKLGLDVPHSAILEFVSVFVGKALSDDASLQDSEEKENTNEGN